MRLSLIAIGVLTAGCGEVVTPPDGAFTVTLEPANVFVRRGEAQMIDVTIVREEGFNDDVTFNVANLPDGVSANTLVIPTDQSTGTLNISANGTATHGIADASVNGSGEDDEVGDAPLRLLVGGPPGTVDESFAGDGTFSGTIPGEVLITRGLTLSNGIVVTGSTATQAITMRLTDAGVLDTSFAGAGFISTGVGGYSEGIAVTSLADGSLIVAGTVGGPGGAGDNDFGIFKYSGAGDLDTTFGNSGIAAFDPGTGFAEFHTVAVEANGSLLVGGALFTAGGPVTGRVLRFSAAGARDPAYDVTEASTTIESSAIQADGKLVLCGALSGDFWLARYNANGTKDIGFGTNGVATTDFAPDVGGAAGLVAVAGGKFLAVGTAGTGANEHVVAARYNANGSLDLSFGLSGKVVTNIAFDTRSPNGAIIDSTGRILLVGVIAGKPSVARLLADGMPDTTFGTAGTGAVALDFGVSGTTGSTGGFGIVIDSDDRILFAGEVGGAGGQQMALARLWP